MSYQTGDLQDIALCRFQSWSRFRQRHFLHSAEFNYAILAGANFAGSTLTQIQMPYANLTGANLKMANLSSSNLHQVNFTNANLIQANLSGATLTNCMLSGAPNQRQFVQCQLPRTCKGPCSICKPASGITTCLSPALPVVRGAVVPLDRNLTIAETVTIRGGTLERRQSATLQGDVVNDGLISTGQYTLAIDGDMTGTGTAQDIPVDAQGYSPGNSTSEVNHQQLTFAPGSVLTMQIDTHCRDRWSTTRSSPRGPFFSRVR